MADFDIAFPIIKNAEGGYANVPADNGGETYFGIARKMHPNWEGWKIVDQHKPLANNQFIQDSSLTILVKGFYRSEFWNKIKGDLIHIQEEANKILDMAINAGVGVAIKKAQSSLGIAQSGVMDELTISKLNNKTDLSA